MTATDPVVFDDEVARLRAVRRYDVLDTPPDGTFDRITALAARLFDVPIALVTVVDTDRIWFKSKYGLDGVDEITRDPGLCSSAILSAEPWIVSDAIEDPRTLANPLVAGEFGLRFYAGAPLTTRDGHNLGTLCIIDREPRELSDEQVAILSDLAALVVDELELRLTALQTVQQEERLRREAQELAEALQNSLLPPGQPDLPGMDAAARYLAGERGLKVGGDFFDAFRLATNDWGIVLGDACGRGARPASLAALTRWTVRALAVRRFDPAEVLRDVNRAVHADRADDDGNDNTDDHYLTTVFARLELDTCGAWVTLASAGHPLPVLVRRSGVVQITGSASFPIGMFETLEAETHRVGLGPGDALVLYTDGITEAREPGGDMFGEERLITTLEGVAGATADTIADAIVGAARSFAGGRLDDDVAVVVVRVPDDAGDDPAARLSDATGSPVDELRLPGYPHGG